MELDAVRLSRDNSRDCSRAYMPYPDVPVSHAASGPLLGLRFAVKDLFDVAGYPTSGGNPMMLARSGIKTAHAPVVAQLLAAGAQFVGKVVTDEFAFSMTGQNAHFGAPRNGADPDRITGGSSSGSASAVSHDTCDFALGTDTGGSVRAPAHHCGLMGIRPSHGRVSLEAAMPLSPSFDTCGWLARRPEVFKRVGQALLGDDRPDLVQLNRWLWPTDLWSMTDPASQLHLGDQANRWREHTAGASPWVAVQAILESSDAMYWNFRYLQGAEAWDSHGRFIEQHQLPLGPGVAERFDWSSTLTQAQIEQATQFRERYTEYIEAILGLDGVMVLPTMPGPAPLISAGLEEAESYRNRAIRLLCVAGLAGLPQVTIPVLRGPSLGLSLIGPRGSDQALIELACHLASPIKA
jgi:amidase